MKHAIACGLAVALLAAAASINATSSRSDRLTLKSPNGKYAIDLMATDDGAFVFVTGPDGKEVTLASAKHSSTAYLGVGRPGSNGHPLAIATDGKRPVVQMSDKHSARLVPILGQ